MYRIEDIEPEYKIHCQRCRRQLVSVILKPKSTIMHYEPPITLLTILEDYSVDVDHMVCRCGHVQVGIREAAEKIIV